VCEGERNGLKKLFLYKPQIRENIRDCPIVEQTHPDMRFFFNLYTPGGVAG